MSSSTVHHPLFARFYTRLVAPTMAKVGGDALRRRNLEGLSGTVVEVGAGEGANFAFYPDAVHHVVAVEPEAYLREQATARSDGRVRVVDGTAERLPLGNGEADAVVLSLVLCSVGDQQAALAEARRVLRPGGEIRFLEHVVAEPGPLRRVQNVLDATLWPRLFGGCHCSRDTAAGIAEAGFDITNLERFRFPEGSRSPASPVILGRAELAGAAR